MIEVLVKKQVLERTHSPLIDRPAININVIVDLRRDTVYTTGTELTKHVRVQSKLQAG